MFFRILHRFRVFYAADGHIRTSKECIISDHCHTFRNGNRDKVTTICKYTFTNVLTPILNHNNVALTTGKRFLFNPSEFRRQYHNR